LVVREGADEQQFVLATLPPSPGQYRLAIGVVVVLVVAFAITAPFTSIQLPASYPFIVALQTAFLIGDLITAALLFAQFAILRWLGLLVLGSGYLFTAAIVIPHALTFPGLITPTGLLAAGTQSTAWLYVFWHLGLPLAVISYSWLKTSAWEGPPLVVIISSAAAVLVLVCGLTWIATAQEIHLPGILNDVGRLTPFAKFANVFLLFLGILALALLWVWRRSVLDLWLTVTLVAFLIELSLAALFAGSRFSLGYYAGRIYSLITAATVLIVLLSETTTLYASLARSVLRRRGAREARQIAVDAMAASIAHEVNQPLGAMVANANAGLRWLNSTTPDLDRARAAFERVVSDGHRAGEVIGSVRAMFKRDVHGRVWLSVNELIREALNMVEVDLRLHGVSVSTELREELPKILVDRGQLQQVFLNLTLNAIEAMRSVTDRVCSLRITSEINLESSRVLITVEDSGTGIDQKNKDRIFETFFSTKSTGTGMGLTICRTIIESHGGMLQASANNPYGTIFHVALPLTA
jgi:signal transduction histidine kinase